MIVTEEEAKTKRCQESFAARTTTVDGRSIYAPGVTPTEFHEISAAPRNCIGPACMAWRWHNWHENEGRQMVVEPVKGYCGKAGRP